MDYKELGIQIRAQRKHFRLTQEELAEQAGISLSFLGHIERGSRKASIETLVSLANALNISTDTLLQGSLINSGSANRQCEYQQREVLREISRILSENATSWGE